MADFVPYNYDNPHRTANMDYQKVLMDHGETIRNWHGEGWTHVQIRDRLFREKATPASLSQVYTLLTHLGLRRTQRDKPKCENTDVDASNNAIKHHSPSQPLGHCPDHYASEMALQFGSVSDDEDFSEVTGLPSDRSSAEDTYIVAKSRLANELVTGTSKFFEFGLVFATVSRSCVRLWLVVRNYLDYCYCIRIRTYQGRGIKHLKDDYELQSQIEDAGLRARQEAAVQKDIDAHAIVFPLGLRSPYCDRREEPFMKKESLGVRLRDGLESQVLDRMSRACFGRLHRLEYGQQVAAVGSLEQPFTTFVDIYTSELLGEISQIEVDT